MPYLQTKILDGGTIHLYPQDIVLFAVSDHHVYFLSTAGYKSTYSTTLKWVKEWLDSHGIFYFHISSNVVACSPHVCGSEKNGRLIYHPQFFNALPEKAKELFSGYVCEHSYLRRIHTASDNYLNAKQKTEALKQVKSNSSEIKEGSAVVKRENPDEEKQQSVGSK
jgi:hypothetical protein